MEMPRKPKKQIPFKVMTLEFNSDKVESYDIMPALVAEYEGRKPSRKPKTEAAFKEFVRDTVLYYWWGKCQHEFLVYHWPTREDEEGDKIDKSFQIAMNFDVVCEILKRNLGLEFKE
ncbi:MAG: hypothetical protein LUD72_10510 [Bacteroidales bacterium]|nr:hypothetical protein [Bacteroidales bacterium]